MTIYYRASPFLSRAPNPLGTDKASILSVCFDSFKKALGSQKVIILNDSLNDSQKAIFDGFEMITAQQGNEGSFHHQLDLASQLDPEEKVFLIEDDYLWLPESIDTIDAALDVLPLISPYDHPGHYTEDRFSSQERRMALINNQTYRGAPSNTLTFACKVWVIKENLDFIKSYGLRDHELFADLPVEMFVPVPSLATHLVSHLLAPNVKWGL